MNTIAIKLINISKKYEIHHEKPTLVEKFVKGPNETFWALHNINLTIRKGECVGIIGPNGSGKTTLLKIVAGITTPTSGTVETYGNVVSLIDLEAGFHPDLTGIQNIYLNGMLLGMTKRKIDKQLHHIIEFADIKQFIDTPVFTYSQGMKLRLGFSIAIYSNPEILILDESMAVGDAQFQAKINHLYKQLFKRYISIIFVSHMLGTLTPGYQRVIEINHGKIVRDRQV
jgi:ABC-type polysaccharide/polyol phosphate transport system ATPase subunit